MIRALPLLAIAIALAASGCGSDSSGETTPPAFSVPAITSPISPTSTAPLTTTKSAPTKSTTTTKGGNSFDRNKPDSPTNDVPPPTGSPQEAFEKQCEQNPQACG